MLRSETEGSPERMQAALAGLRAYQTAQRMPRPQPPAVAAKVGRASVRDFGGSGPLVLFVPSLINSADVLDLTERNSLLKWLANAGFRPRLLDWGHPSPDERDLSIAGHVERYLLPLIAALGEPVILAGYCLGGTMTIAAAALSDDVAGLALIAAPWVFSGFPSDTRARLVDLWSRAERTTEELGLMPMEVLQTSFWSIDPARTVSKFERFGRMDPGSDSARGFVALEDWANDGPPLTAAAGRELVIDLIDRDQTGHGNWRVDGKTIDPAAIRCPILNIVSTTDKITPAATAAPVGERLVLNLGHVGMIVGGSARPAMWKPFAAWLSQVRNRC